VLKIPIPKTAGVLDKMIHVIEMVTIL